MDRCLFQLLHTGRNLFVDHRLNMHDFVMTGVFDGPMKTPHCQCEMLVGITVQDSMGLLLLKMAHTQKKNII